MKDILRIIVAVVFLISGFVKAVDVVGFSFKLEEYFSPGVFNMPFLEKQSLIIAIIVVVLELVLGFLLLMKSRLKLTLTALIALCIFFVFLTFYSAYFNVVTDCGCFGEALKLMPWQSFWKDIALLVALIILWILYRKDFGLPEKQNTFKKYAFPFAFLTMVFVINWGIAHEPLIDFRDYSIGTDLNLEKKKIAQDPSVYKTYYTLLNKKTSEILEVNQDDFVNDKKYWEEGTPWAIQEDKTTSKIVKEGYSSEITKFRIEDSTGNDVTETVLKAPKAVLLFSYHPAQADRNIIAKTEAKLKVLPGTFVMGVSTDLKTFKTIPNSLMDGTAIKTIARSNPFVLVLNNGKIVDKKSAKDFLND
ncbi:MAG: DoxX family protein [Weeksellaceae bacterium]|nr:DoxX family protein [Weeksellaceae bacterium]